MIHWEDLQENLFKKQIDKKEKMTKFLIQMKYYLQIGFILLLAVGSLYSCQKKMSQLTNDTATTYTPPSTQAKNESTVLTCKLPAKKMLARKLTVLASLKKQVLERKELPSGYAFRFPGTDKVIDELTEFIKTERECCDFFTFNLSISGDKSEVWLELTGPEGAKDFITQELEL